jgi:hypothetical protein
LICRKCTQFDHRMDEFTCVSGLTSVVLALGIARLLVGIMERRQQIKLYWVHLMWVANIFLFLAMQWWILFRWQGWTDWNFFLFAFLLASPTIAFLMCVMLFHEPISEHSDFREHFYANHRWFFTLGAILPLLDVLDTTLKGYSHLIAQGIIYPITIILVTSLSIIGALTNNEKYHKFFAVFFFIYLSAFISINLNILS